jgi:hypothetical protein
MKCTYFEIHWHLDSPMAQASPIARPMRLRPSNDKVGVRRPDTADTMYSMEMEKNENHVSTHPDCQFRVSKLYDLSLLMLSVALVGSPQRTAQTGERQHFWEELSDSCGLTHC